MMKHIREKEIAIMAVEEAADLCRDVQAWIGSTESMEKVDHSLVTLADFGAQALVCHRLKAAFPDDPIVAEEDAAALRTTDNASRLAEVTDYVRRFQQDATPDDVCRWIDAGSGTVAERYWTLDPIDGTLGFLRGEQYAIALALVEQGQVQIGVLACPSLPLDLDEPASPTGSLFVAVQGLGTAMAPLGTTQFTTVHIASGLNRASWRFVESVETRHGNPELQQEIARRVGITRPALRVDSQAKYGLLARGDAALYLRFPAPASPGYHEKIWDHAAGLLIVEEAGGLVTDMRGKRLDFGQHAELRHNLGVVAGMSALHHPVLEALHDRFFQLRPRSAEATETGAGDTAPQ
jgi:3'(2'), 5'-bisphosphate nucleotidase